MVVRGFEVGGGCSLELRRCNLFNARPLTLTPKMPGPRAPDYMLADPGPTT